MNLHHILIFHIVYTIFFVFFLRLFEDPTSTSDTICFILHVSSCLKFFRLLSELAACSNNDKKFSMYFPFSICTVHFATNIELLKILTFFPENQTNIVCFMDNYSMVVSMINTRKNCNYIPQY